MHERAVVRTDWVVQHRVRIAGHDQWGEWSVGVPKGRNSPSAAMRFVDQMREGADDDTQWRVVQVTQEVVY